MENDTLPLVGAQFELKDLAPNCEWLIESQRDLEIQDPSYSRVLDSDWRPQGRCPPLPKPASKRVWTQIFDSWRPLQVNDLQPGQHRSCLIVEVILALMTARCLSQFLHPRPV